MSLKAPGYMAFSAFCGSSGTAQQVIKRGRFMQRFLLRQAVAESRCPAVSASVAKGGWRLFFEALFG